MSRSHSLRDAISVVSQDVTLFDDTIRANIALGRLDATEDEIVAAAHAAAAHDFIIAQPNGYDSLIGDRGMRLSGGQRQRLALARAILKNAPILLLDEATSALDTESEQLVQAALARFTQGRTTLVIAHRLSTVQSARPDLRHGRRADHRDRHARGTHCQRRRLCAPVAHAISGRSPPRRGAVGRYSRRSTRLTRMLAHPLAANERLTSSGSYTRSTQSKNSIGDLALSSR